MKTFKVLFIGLMLALLAAPTFAVQSIVSLGSYNYAVVNSASTPVTVEVPIPTDTTYQIDHIVVSGPGGDASIVLSQKTGASTYVTLATWTTTAAVDDTLDVDFATPVVLTRNTGFRLVATGTGTINVTVFYAKKRSGGY